MLTLGGFLDDKDEFPRSIIGDGTMEVRSQISSGSLFRELREKKELCSGKEKDHQTSKTTANCPMKG